MSENARVWRAVSKEKRQGTLGDLAACQKAAREGLLPKLTSEHRLEGGEEERRVSIRAESPGIREIQGEGQALGTCRGGLGVGPSR